MPFIDADFSLEHEVEDYHKDLRSGEVLSKMQGRPLPAPPRPPRHRRDPYFQTLTRRSLPREITPDVSETVASTQTDPLPDDVVIEEEITTAKLIVAPSRSGSQQVFISTERIPSPVGDRGYRSATTPPIPPLPSNLSQKEEDSLRAADREESDRKIPHHEETRQFDTSQLEILRSVLFSTEEPLRIPSLEVGDLRVDRLTVSQLEAYKVAASEIDAIVVSATEMSNKNEEGIHPSLLQELIAIRSQLEAVTAAQSQSRPQSAMEDACTATSNERIDEPSIRRSPERKAYTRESSPMLEMPSTIESVGQMGRSIFPQTGSMTDLTSDSVTSSETAIKVSVTKETAKAEPEKGKSTVDSPSTKVTTTTTTTTAAAVELPVSRSRSRSRSPSPSRIAPGVVRQTASPVRSLPPVISVTPDIITASSGSEQDNISNQPLTQETSSGVQPQRAVISYRSSTEDQSPPPPPPSSRASSKHPQSRETSQSPPLPIRESSKSPTPPTRESSRSPPLPRSPPTAQIPGRIIAFPSSSHIPPEFFALADPTDATATAAAILRQARVVGLEAEQEPGVTQVAGQLVRALSNAGSRSIRHFLDSIVTRLGGSDELDAEDKVRRVELAICALLLLVAVLVLVSICTPKTVTHHHHWDYFNPPQ